MPGWLSKPIPPASTGESRSKSCVNSPSVTTVVSEKVCAPADVATGSGVLPQPVVSYSGLCLRGSPAWSKREVKPQLLCRDSCPRFVSEWASALDAPPDSLQCVRHQSPIDSTCPVRWSYHWPGRQNRRQRLVPLAASPDARPTPILGALDQFGTQSVTLDVASHRDEVFVSSNTRANAP